MSETSAVSSGAPLALQAAERHAFIGAMARAASGVTVVTSDGPLGQFGQTVSAMASVSADPPLLLICINRQSPINAAIGRHRSFGVSVLRADQQRISESFSGRPRSGKPYDFDSALWERATTGSPLLVGAVARFDCELELAQQAGSHTIFLGRVRYSATGAGHPLIYTQRAYGEATLFPSRRQPHPTPDSLDLVDQLELEELWG